MKNEITNSKKTFLFIFYILMAFNGGFFEIYSLYGFSLFTFLQTGNVANVTFNFIKGNNEAAFLNLTSLISFVIGFSLVILISRFLKRKNIDNFIVSLFGCMFFIILIMAIPTYHTFGIMRIIEVILLTFYGVVLLNGFKSFNGVDFVPTMTTNNLRRCVENGIEGYLDNDKVKKSKFITYLTIFLSFATGIVTSSLLLCYLHINKFSINSNCGYEINLFLIVPLITTIICYIIYKFHKEEINTSKRAS